MGLGQWLGVAIMLVLCVGLVWWIVYVVKKEKKDKE
jgi:cytoskeletal protein RodZ